MLATINRAKLVDISTIAIDKNLPQAERIAAYKRQIQNPNRYRCGKFIVTAVYANNGVTIEDCLRGMLSK